MNDDDLNVLLYYVALILIAVICGVITGAIG
jgi:hypothetical protein